MKQVIVALVLLTVSLPSLAETNRPRPGHRRGPVVVRPRPHRPLPPVVVRPRPHRPLPPVVVRPRPIPRPYPGPMACQVVMTDRFNRVVRRYWGHENRHSVCPSGLRACNYDLRRMGMWGHRCATVRW